MTTDLLDLAARVADLECQRAGSFAWRRGRRAVLTDLEYMTALDLKDRDARGFCWGPDLDTCARLGEARRALSQATDRDWELFLPSLSPLPPPGRRFGASETREVA